MSGRPEKRWGGRVIGDKSACTTWLQNRRLLSPKRMRNDKMFFVEIFSMQSISDRALCGFQVFVDRAIGMNEKPFAPVQPSDELRAWWKADPQARWDEFYRRYQRELEHQPGLCEQLRQRASTERVILVYAFGTPCENVAVPLKRHLEDLECRLRWQNGWMIGGHTAGVRDAIIRRGGIYYSRHKVWMMPSEEDTRVIRSILPGDF